VKNFYNLSSSYLEVKMPIISGRKGYISPIFAFAAFLFVAASFGGFLFFSKSTGGNFSSRASQSGKDNVRKVLVSSSNKIKADIFPEFLSSKNTPVTAEVKTSEGFTPEEVLVKLTIRDVEKWEARRGEIQITTDSFNYVCGQVDKMDGKSNPYTASLKCTKDQNATNSYLNVYFDNLLVKCPEPEAGSTQKAGYISVSVLAENETASATIKCQ
jgi:hypothetical protein